MARWIDERLAAGEPGIITCSNLKRAYRQVTIGRRKDVTLVYLHAAEPVIAADEHPVLVAVDGTLTRTVIDRLRKVAASAG